MHGLIFTSFRDFTRATLPDHADAIWEKAPRFVELDVYPDEDFERLVDRASLESGAARRTILVDFGRYAATTSFRLLRPEYYEQAADTRQFFLHVERQIHEELRASLPGAAPPRLQVRAFGAGGVSIAYISERKLCELLEGLVLGTAEFYGEDLLVEQSTCMHRGDAACSFFVSPRETVVPETVVPR